MEHRHLSEKWQQRWGVNRGIKKCGGGGRRAADDHKLGCLSCLMYHLLIEFFPRGRAGGAAKDTQHAPLQHIHLFCCVDAVTLAEDDLLSEHLPLACTSAEWRRRAKLRLTRRDTVSEETGKNNYNLKSNHQKKKKTSSVNKTFKRVFPGVIPNIPPQSQQETNAHAVSTENE